MNATPDNVAGRTFTTREIARLARLSSARVRRCVHAGFLHPRRGPRRRFEYDLSDLLVLRATRKLLDAKLAPRRIAELVEEIRSQLPGDRDVASVSLSVDGERVIVDLSGERIPAALVGCDGSAPYEAGHIVAVCPEFLEQGAPDHSAATGDEDLHSLLLLLS